ncbi:hypothetical protein THRCLA_08202 [Thraustotheca clavata]|uniref:Uncharacterized protein n=1 Tax=Thraustotheca clavata TaxID=74557 RepID=A0A1V9Z8G8_9STRA|nr:hypothetical protein THRCLA_08202 [Thraustotheca clavata]
MSIALQETVAIAINILFKNSLFNLFPDFDFSFLNTADNSNVQKTRKRIRKRHADDVAFLKATVDLLTQQLQELEAAKTEVTPKSKWEDIAQRQATEAKLAIQKNQRLREAVVEQLQLAESLQKLLAKTKKFAIESLCESDVHIPDDLTLDPTARAAWMHTILDEEYGLMEYNEPTRRAEIADDEEHHRVILKFTQAQIIPAPMAISIEAVWKFLSLDSSISLEIVDENMIYFKFEGFANGFPTLYANYCAKRYFDYKFDLQG